MEKPNYEAYIKESKCHLQVYGDWEQRHTQAVYDQLYSPCKRAMIAERKQQKKKGIV